MELVTGVVLLIDVCHAVVAPRPVGKEFVGEEHEKGECAQMVLGLDGYRHAQGWDGCGVSLVNDDHRGRRAGLAIPAWSVHSPALLVYVHNSLPKCIDTGR